MLEAVQVIHKERIVHSDLKPGNFLLVNGRLKVIDFGIAKRISNDTTNISRDASVGTLSYMAPEAVKQGQLKLGRASDIWSLGIILYQMVYGHPPFAHLEPMQRLLRLSDPGLLMQFPPDHRLSGHSGVTQAQVVEVLGQCLQRDPRKRPSLPELLAHPFLSSSAEVRRETVQGVVRVLMKSMMRTVSASLQIEAVDASQQDWQVLADEVWEHLSALGRGTSDEVCSSHAPGSNKASSEVLEDHLSGLAPLEELLRRCKAQTPSGSSGGGKLEEKENIPGSRQPLLQIHPKRVTSNPLLPSTRTTQGLR